MSEDATHPDASMVEEQLSAYLDGELSDEAARQVEQWLAADPEVRRTLQRMERTWEVLDKLDEEEVDEGFTRSTLEMVAQSAEQEAEREAREAPRRRRRRWLAGTACLAGAALLGFLAVTLFWPDPNQQLLDDLPVLEHLEEYRQIKDFEFLQRLYQEGLFRGDEQDGEEEDEP